MSILEQIEIDQQQASADHLATYQQIIGRLDDPRPGDKVNLAKLLTTLALTPADAASDAVAMKQRAKLEADAADAAAKHKASIDAVPDALVVFKQREAELEAAKRAFFAAQGELCRLEDAKNMADLRRRQAAEGIANLRATNARVF
jgi:hypothetical protein